MAADLLDGSELVEYKKYAVYDGKASYCAQEHRPGRWHGYSVGWKEVPPRLGIRWRRQRRVSNRDIKQNWD